MANTNFLLSTSLTNNELSSVSQIQEFIPGDVWDQFSHSVSNEGADGTLNFCCIPHQLLNPTLLHGFFSTLAEHGEALFVNRTWNRAFCRAFLFNVEIKTRKKAQKFFRTLYNTADRGQPLGPLVKELHLKNGVGLDNSELEALPAILPNLEVLDFKKEIWRYLRIPKTFERWTKIRKLPETTSVNRTLSLVCPIGERLTHLRFSDEVLADPYWVTFLAFTGNLEVLELAARIDPDVSSITVTYSQIASVLLLLPKLSTLVLENLGLFMSDYEQRLASSSDLFPRIRKLDVRSQLDNCYWLIFFASKFPSTEYLRFDVSWRELALSEVTESEAMAVEQAILKYAATNKHLTDLILIDISHICPYPPYEDLFRALQKAGTKPSKLSYLCFNRDAASLDKAYYSALTETLDHNTPELDVYAWWGLDDINEILMPIRHFEHLTKLQLMCASGSALKDEGCPIDAILECLPNLTNLSVGWVWATLKDVDDDGIPEDYGETKRFKLTVLRFDHVSFDTAVMSYIGRSCRDLKDLDISMSNRRFHPEEDGQVLIDMPHQRFERISIMILGLDPGWTKPQVHLYPMGIFSLTRLDYNKKQLQRSKFNTASEEVCAIISENYTRWYHLYDIYGELGLSGISTRRIQRLPLDDGRRVLDYQMSSDDWHAIGNVDNVRWVFKRKRDWKQDVFLGYTNIRCRSVKSLYLDSMPIHFWNE